MSDANSIVVDHVSRVADGGTRVLDGINWTLPAGSCAAIIGPSGSGKSSLLRLLNRLDEVSAGTIFVSGRSLMEWDVRELRTHVVWVPQSPALTSDTVDRYLARPLGIGVVSRQQHEKRIGAAREIAHITELPADRPVDELSGGERLRLALARALLLDPHILLLDEPTSSLDGEAARRVLTALRAWQRDRGKTLVVVTHRLADVRLLGGELLVLAEGRVAHCGRSTELLESSTGREIRGLLAGDEPQ